MPVLPGRMPQISVRKITPGNSPTASGRKSRASFPMAGISTFDSIILALVRSLINDSVPVTRLMASGAPETPLAQHPADHPIEIAMRNQGGYATLFGAGDQDVGCLDGAYCRGARFLDFGMKARMP